MNEELKEQIRYDQKELELFIKEYPQYFQIYGLNDNTSDFGNIRNEKDLDNLIHYLQSRKGGKIFFFDMDDTLIENDKKLLEDSYYLALEPYKTLPQFEVFKKISKQYPTFIITNRHPLIRKEIAELLHFPEKNILCRRYLLKQEDVISWTEKSKENEIFLKMFLTTMFLDKYYRIHSLYQMLDRYAELAFQGLWHYKKIYIIDDFSQFYYDKMQEFKIDPKMDGLNLKIMNEYKPIPILKKIFKKLKKKLAKKRF